MSDVHTNYQEYLESYAWKALKKTKLEEQSQCESCWLPATSVHHLTYERLWREKTEDIVSICERCHEECHHVGGYQIKNDEEILRRRFEEVRNTYLWEKEIELIELKEIFKYDFSKDEKPRLKKTTQWSSTMTGLSFSTNNHPIRINLGWKNETQILADWSRNSFDIGNNPFFMIDQSLYFAYKINYRNEENYEEISNHWGYGNYYWLNLSCFDIYSFEAISAYLFKDIYGVYLVKYFTEPSFWGAEEIRIYKTSISPSWFMRIWYPYYRNGGNIYCEPVNYYYYNNFDNPFPEDILRVKWADLETFEVLDGWRARDKNYIYDYWKIIEQIIHEGEDSSYYIWDNWGCSYGKYWDDCKTLFSDPSDWCGYCSGA